MELINIIGHDILQIDPLHWYQIGVVIALILMSLASLLSILYTFIILPSFAYVTDQELTNIADYWPLLLITSHNGTEEIGAGRVRYTTQDRTGHLNTHLADYTDQCLFVPFFMLVATIVIVFGWFVVLPIALYMLLLRVIRFIFRTNRRAMRLEVDGTASGQQ